MRTWLLQAMVEGMVFTVDIWESTVRDIWKSPEERECSRLNMASRLDSVVRREREREKILKKTERVWLKVAKREGSRKHITEIVV